VGGEIRGTLSDYARAEEALRKAMARIATGKCEKNHCEKNIEKQW
jgi:hypothetical protein